MAINKSQIQIMKNLKDFLKRFGIQYKERNDLIIIKNCKPYLTINTPSAKVDEFIYKDKETNKETKISVTRLYDNQIILEISKEEKRERIFLQKDLQIVYTGKTLVFTF